MYQKQNKLLSYGSSPSSSGSHVSVISIDPIAEIWWRPTILLCFTSIYVRKFVREKYHLHLLLVFVRKELYIKLACTSQKLLRSTVTRHNIPNNNKLSTLINSTIITVLLIALPIALKTMSQELFSFKKITNSSQ